jgi:hypothetical protein
MFTTQHLRACVVAAVAASISCHRAAARAVSGWVESLGVAGSLRI